LKESQEAVGDVFVAGHAALQSGNTEDAGAQGGVIFRVSDHADEGNEQTRGVLVVGMDHDDDIRAATEGLAVTGLLVTAVAEILSMHEGDQAELAGEFGGAVLTAVINQDDLIDKFGGQIAVGSFEGLGRIIGGHDHYDFFAVQHTVKLRPRIRRWIGNHCQLIIPCEMGGGKNVRVVNRAKGQYPHTQNRDGNPCEARVKT